MPDSAGETRWKRDPLDCEVVRRSRIISSAESEGEIGEIDISENTMATDRLTGPLMTEFKKSVPQGDNN
jgi:hypothetical protein